MVTTTAEGVETEEQRTTLHELGCTQMQGHLLSPLRQALELRSLMAARAAVEDAACFWI
jgi:EAL domain-containing protein (putative c-di-GMP-specific phosphodiesterase class I)